MKMSVTDDMVTHKAELKKKGGGGLLVTFAKLPMALPHLYV